MMDPADGYHSYDKVMAYGYEGVDSTSWEWETVVFALDGNGVDSIFSAIFNEGALIGVSFFLLFLLPYGTCTMAMANSALDIVFVCLIFGNNYT